MTTTPKRPTLPSRPRPRLLTRKEQEAVAARNEAEHLGKVAAHHHPLGKLHAPSTKELP